MPGFARTGLPPTTCSHAPLLCQDRIAVRTLFRKPENRDRLRQCFSDCVRIRGHVTKEDLEDLIRLVLGQM